MKVLMDVAFFLEMLAFGFALLALSSFLASLIRNTDCETALKWAILAGTLLAVACIPCLVYVLSLLF